MKYTIIVDKQPSTNPSDEKKEYIIDIEELRTYQGVSDTLKVTPDMAYVIRRLSLSEYGVLSILDEPKQENLKDLNITLFEGENYIYILNAEGNKISLSYVIKNDFTDTYPTKADMKSSITQTAQSIELSVNQKLEGYSTTEEMNSAIKVSADSINSEVSKKVGENEIISKINQSAEQVQIDADKISLEGKQIDLTGEDINITSDTLSIDKYGSMTLKGTENVANIKVELNTDTERYITINPARIYFKNDVDGHEILLYNAFNGAWLQLNSGSKSIRLLNNGDDFVRISLTDGINNTIIMPEEVSSPKLTQTSLESIKKNISHYNENALETILNSDIYSYNLKTEKDTDKKHIGFVIGDKYKTPKEVMNNEGTAIELYSAIGILWKGMQEQQKKIEELENKLKEVTNG